MSNILKFLTLTLLHVAFIRNSSATLWPQPEKLIGFWPLSSKYTVKDIGPNHYNGDAQAQNFTTGPFGMPESAVSPTADNTKLLRVFNSKVSVVDSSFTVSFFFKRGGSVSSGGIFEFLDKSYLNRAFQIRYENATTFELSANSATIGHVSMIEPLGEWTFLSMVYNHSETTLALYGKNGLVMPPTFKPQLKLSLFYSNNGVRVGYALRFGQGLSTSDAVASLMVYSTALTSDEVYEAKDACQYVDGSLTTKIVTTTTVQPTSTTTEATTIELPVTTPSTPSAVEITTTSTKIPIPSTQPETTIVKETTPPQTTSTEAPTVKPTTDATTLLNLQIQLREAAKRGDVEKVEQLLALGFLDVNWRRDDDTDSCCWGYVRYGTALLHATHTNPKNLSEVVRLLVGNGADVNVKESHDGTTPLIFTVHYGQLETVRFLVDRGADVNATMFNGATALKMAADQRDVEIVRFLIDRGAAYGQDDLKAFHTQLKEAVKAGDLNQTQTLLQLGFLDINWRFNDDTDTCCWQYVTAGTPLLHAVHRNPSNVYEIVRLLVENAADVNVKESHDGNTALIFAAHYGQTETVKLLLDRGAEINVRNKNGETALKAAADQRYLELVRLLMARSAVFVQDDLKVFHVQLRDAAKRGDVDEIRKLLELGFLDVNWRASDDFDNCCWEYVTFGTALVHATHANPSNVSEVVRILVDNGADVNVKETRGGMTALVFSAHYGQLENVRFLLDRGADMNATNNNQLSALKAAADQLKLEIVLLLMDRGANFVQSDLKALNVQLREAAKRGDLGQLGKLLKLGFLDVNWRDNDDYDTCCWDYVRYGTVLIHAAHSNPTNVFDVVRLLLTYGADVSATEAYSGNTALIFTAHYGRLETVDFLLDRGAEIDFRNRAGISALKAAVDQSYPDVVRRLIDRGAFYVQNDLKAFHVQLRKAVKKGDVTVVRTWLQFGILDVDWRDNDDFDNCCWEYVKYGTALIHAAHTNPFNVFDIVRLLVTYGADVNATEAYSGNTALIFTAHYGQLETVRFLLDLGSDINVKNKAGVSALKAAADESHLDTVRLLMDRGAFSVQDDFKALNIQLRQAAKKGDVDELRTWLQLGYLDVNWRSNDDGDNCCWSMVRFGTALIHATHSNPSKLLEVVQLLVDNGADVNVKEDYRGWTALSLAVHYDQNETVALLLDRGADINATNKYGETAIKIAADVLSSSLVRLLIDRGALYNQGDFSAFHSQLREAAKNGDVDQVRRSMLLGFLDVNWRTSDDYDSCCWSYVKFGTVLIHATHRNPSTLFEVVRILVDNGADVELNEIYAGNTALIFASHSGRLDTAGLLLDRGADINAKNKDDHTSLMEAAKEGKLDVVRLLLSRGASRDGCTQTWSPNCNLE